MSFISDSVTTRHIKGKSAVYAYRDFGVASSAPPLVLLTRFRGTMDHWDPAFLEVLAGERRVILFDNAGVSESTGEVATTFAGMAETAVDFITALGLKGAQVMTTPLSTEEHFLYLFFGRDEESERNGRESLRRLEPRLSKSRAEVAPEAWGRQLQAIMEWAGGNGAAWSRLQEITIPVHRGSHRHTADDGPGIRYHASQRLCETVVRRIAPL